MTKKASGVGLLLIFIIIVGTWFFVKNKNEKNPQILEVKTYTQREKIEIPNSSYELRRQARGFYLCENGRQKNEESEEMLPLGGNLVIKRFLENPSYFVEDSFGTCMDYNLTAKFYEKDYAGSYKEGALPKLNLQLEDGEKINASYTPVSYGCGGSISYRIIKGDDVLVSALEKIGKTATGENVYIFQEKDLVVNNIYDEKNEKRNIWYDIYSSNSDSGEQLRKFIYDAGGKEVLEKILETQKDEKYPLLIIDGPFHDYLMFVREDIVWIPGC